MHRDTATMHHQAMSSKLFAEKKTEDETAKPQKRAMPRWAPKASLAHAAGPRLGGVLSDEMGSGLCYS